MARGENPLDRRARLLDKEWTRRAASIEKQLFEPAPPFAVKMSEQDAFRRYLVHKQDGFFLNARESNGGHMRDEDVDKYAAWGRRMEAKYTPHLLLRDLTNGEPEYNAIIEEIRRAHERLNDPNDEPEDYGVTGDVDAEFE